MLSRNLQHKGRFVPVLLLGCCLACACLRSADCSVTAKHHSTRAKVARSTARRVARASARQNKGSHQGGSGLQHALAAGVPVDYAYMSKHPEIANKVPLTAPLEDQTRYETELPQPGRRWAPKLSPDKTASLQGSTPGSSDQQRVIDGQYEPILPTSPFVTTSGTHFVLDGKVIYPSGTSWYNLFRMDPAEVQFDAQHQWVRGVRLFRAWAHINGYGSVEKTPDSAQPVPGYFNEPVLARFDAILNILAQTGQRIILSMVNFFPHYGGIQWYVDNIVGTGSDQHLFYTDTRVRAAYKLWLQKLARRRNTVNGRLWAEDPTIFAWELCNECHTSDNYEIQRGLLPGSLVFNWQVEMSDYLKNALNVKSMVTNGNEGYRALGPYDTTAAVTYPYLNWMNSGLKGEDFNRNLFVPNIDFATLHVYPSNFGIPNTTIGWLNEPYIGARQQLAQRANKPLLLEEFGAPRDYLVPRSVVLESIMGAANAYKLAGTLVWESFVTLPYDDSGYDFTFLSAGNASVLTQNLWMLDQRAAGVPQPWPYNCQCTDQPPDSTTTCQALVASTTSALNGCCSPVILAGNSAFPYGFCQQTCGNCGCSGTVRSCDPFPSISVSSPSASQPVPPRRPSRRRRRQASKRKTRTPK